MAPRRRQADKHPALGGDSASELFFTLAEKAQGFLPGHKIIWKLRKEYQFQNM